MRQRQQSDASQRTTEQAAALPVGKSALTAPDRAGSQGRGQTGVGKTALTSTLAAPPATSEAALPTKAGDTEVALQQLQGALARVQQSAQEVGALRARVGERSVARQPEGGDQADHHAASPANASTTTSASEPGSESEDDTPSLEELDAYLAEVQIFEAQAVQLETAHARLVRVPPRAQTQPQPPGQTAPEPSTAVQPPERERSPSPDPPPATTAEDAAMAPVPGSSFDYDWLKRAAKATSYGLALAGAGASFLGWSALYPISKVQQIGQASGSIGKNFAGAVGDYGDYRDKAGKGENTDGLLLKSGGQVVAGVGQVLNLAGMVAANGLVLRATGSFVNALGMVAVGVGELQPAGEKKNVAKAATNFVAAVFAALGGIGFAIDQGTVGAVMDEVVRGLDAAASASSAFTPFGGAADDAKNSKAAGDTKRERLLNDPKPGGQAISAIGSVMNTAALILNKVASTAGTPDEAMKMRIAARVLGAAGSMIAAVGNGFTAKGEWSPAKAPAREPDSEQGIALRDLGDEPAPAT